MGTRSLPKRLVRSLRVGGEITGGRDGDADVSLDWLCDRAGRGRLRPALAAALDADGVEPDVGVADVGQVALLQVSDRFVQRRAHPRHLAGAHAVYAHGLRHALHLPSEPGLDVGICSDVPGVF